VLPNLSDPSDIERLAEGYRGALEVVNRREIRRLCTDPPPGQPPDEGGVVDASGRVHGTEALSVADASIMPNVPSGFTHVPTIMIAERLAEHIASLT
jgi:GMC oxidoreductase